MINQFQVFPVLPVPRMIHLTHLCFLSKSLSNSLKSRLFSRMKVVSAELSVCVSSQIRLSKNALWPAFQMYFSQAGCHFFLSCSFIYLDLNRAVLGSAPVDLDQYLSSTQAVSWLSMIHYWLTSCYPPILQRWLQEDKLFIPNLKGFLSHTRAHMFSSASLVLRVVPACDLQHSTTQCYTRLSNS